MISNVVRLNLSTLTSFSFLSLLALFPIHATVHQRHRFRSSGRVASEENFTHIGSPSYLLVVARFNEDLEWIRSLSVPPENVLILNKGGFISDIAVADYKIQNLQNYGREASSLVFYIITTYYMLPEYTIFMQGDPFKHMKLVNRTSFGHELLNTIASRPNASQPLFSELFVESLSTYQGLQVGNYLEFFFGRVARENIRFVAGLQYILTRKSILSTPIETYVGIYERLYGGRHIPIKTAHFEKRPFDSESLTPWDFERLASYFFLEVSE